LALETKNLTGIGFMLGAAVSFAAFSATVKLVGDEISLYQIVFFRGGVAFLMLSAWMLIRTGSLPTGKNRRGLIVRSLLGFTALLMYVFSLIHIDLALASALNQSSPVFVGLFAFLILKERPHTLIPVLVLVGFIGAAMIVSPDLRSVNAAGLVGLGSAVLSALAYTWVRKLRQTDRPETIVLWFSGTVTILSFPLIFTEGWTWPDLQQWVSLLLIGVFSLFGQLLLTWAYRFGSASIVSPFLYASVLLSFLAGWAFWSEWPGSAALAGAGLLVVSSIGIAVLAGRTRGRYNRP
jgi:drug/metabolite transporter (DMT)-like permease